MGISEVFPNPTVKQVIFQIRFPNLFYIENKIGDFQLKVMNYFTESSLLFKRQILLANVGSGVKVEDLPETDIAKKIWHFSSPLGIELNVLNDSMDITSSFHKTYNIEGHEKFRDVIRNTVDAFLEVTQIPLLTRIGLRYIDECPIYQKDNRSFQSYYNSTFPLTRFSLDKASEMDFKVVYDKGDCFLRYAESLQTDEALRLILDFDCYKINIESKKYLEVTDRLHEIVSDEYRTAINDPLVDYMRKPKEACNGHRSCS